VGAKVDPLSKKVCLMSIAVQSLHKALSALMLFVECEKSSSNNCREFSFVGLNWSNSRKLTVKQQEQQCIALRPGITQFMSICQVPLLVLLLSQGNL